MSKLQEIKGTEGLYEIRKAKIMYELGYNNNFAYIRNIDTNETKVKWFDGNE